MSSDDLPDGLHALISHHAPSMDHIAVLLMVRAAADTAPLEMDVVRESRLDRTVVRKVLEDLTHSGMIKQDRDRFRYAPAAGLAESVQELADMYHTRPVTLVRAIYDRPNRAVRSFADAFRVRKEGT